MALFKIFKGSDSAKITDPNATGYKTPVDGYAYYDTTSKLFYIDAAYDASNPTTITRHPINAAVAGVAGTALNGVYYGTCSTQRATVIKVVTLEDDTGFDFTTGVVLVIRFIEGSSSDSIVVKIGDRFYQSDTYGITEIDSGAVIPFICDGSKWCMLYAGGETYSSLEAESGGTDESLVTTGEKYIWNSLTTSVPSHTHGNIQNGGTLQTTDVTIATGDKLVITDNSNSSKVARASLSFDTTKTGKCLTQAGTWADFNTYVHPTTTAKAAAAVKVGNDTNGHVVIGAALTASDVGLGDVENIALSSWTGSTNITTLGTISIGTVPLANISGATDLKAIEALSETSGLLKKTAANTWTLDTTNYGTVAGLDAGVGLVTTVTNNGTITTSGTIKANLNNESSLGILGSTDRLYAVGVDINGKLCVNVPWVGSIIQDNLTSSTNTTDALSAKQGYLLANGSARDSTKLPLAGGEMSGSITVDNNSAIDLGSSSKAWNNIYANTFNGAMSHHINIGGKQYNGSSDITIYASDLGVASALNFAGIISETLPNMHDTGYPSTSDVHLYSNGNLVPKSSGTVVICHDTQDEFLWSEDASGQAAWYSLGLASSFSLHNHTHGNILNNGAMTSPILINNVSTSSASKAIVTDSSSNITIEDLTVSDPSVLNNANTVSFISNISQSSTGKITAVKSNISDVYVYNTGDIMTGNLFIAKAGDTYVQVENENTGVKLNLDTGSGVNHGIYSYGYYDGSSFHSAGKWMIYRNNAGNVILNGNADTATKATQDGSGNTITSKYVTVDTAQNITGLKTFKSLIQAYRYSVDTAAHSLPFMTFDKPGSNATGIGPDGTNNRIHFGPCPLDGSSWVSTSTFNSNEWHFQGYLTTTNTLAVPAGIWQQVELIHADSNAQSAGWYRTCVVTARHNYADFLLSLTGGWNNGAPNVVLLHICMRNGQANIATLHGGFTGRITQVRLVKNATNTAYLDLYLSATSSATAALYGNFLGNVAVSNVATTNTITTSTENVLDTVNLSSYNFQINGTGKFTSVYGAVWNDYAEYRITKDIIESGRCVIETGKDDLVLSTERLQPGAEIVSDTFGFAIGETDEAKTPIASNGRVLAYPFEDIEEFRKNIGRPVCSGPNGTVSIMTDEEYQKYGYCAIGTISAIPSYEEWGEDKVKVNGRVWIRIR